MHYGPEDHRRALGGPGQQLAQLSHPRSYRRIIPKPAKQLVGHQPANNQHMRARQCLSGRYPDQCRQVCHLGIEPQRPRQPSICVVGQLSRSLCRREERAGRLLAGYSSMPTVAEHDIDRIESGSDRGRHALESRKIGQRVQHR